MEPILLFSRGFLLFIGGLLLSLLTGHYLIPYLKKLKFGQFIRELGPQSHLDKGGTPTIGGVIFLLPFLVITCLIKPSAEYWLVVFMIFGYGLIGFFDDIIKIKKKQNLGLTAKQKIFGQIVVIGLFILLYTSHSYATWLVIPFWPQRVLDLGYVYFPFLIFIILGTVNAVNLTDGLDGLSTSVTLIISLFFVFISYISGHLSLVWLNLAMAGGLVGFLHFNRFPAKVFMGDTGSLALGGYVVAMTILLDIPLFLPIFGIIYLVEALSVIIQVLYFKKTKKRVFKMAPLHHHYELNGFEEKQIVWRFGLVTLVACGLSLTGYLMIG